MHILVGTNITKQEEMLQLYYATGLTREKAKQNCNCKLLPCSITIIYWTFVTQNLLHCQWQTAQVKEVKFSVSDWSSIHLYKYINIIMLSKLDALILRPLNTDQNIMFTFTTCERPNLTAKNISCRIVSCKCQSPSKGPSPNFDSSMVCEVLRPPCNLWYCIIPCLHGIGIFISRLCGS